MLNSAQHDIYPGHKYQNTNKLNFFLLKRAEHGIYPDNTYQNANRCWHFNIM